MNDEIKTVLEVGGLIIAGVVSHVRLQGQVNEAQRGISDVKHDVKEQEIKADKVQENTIRAMSEMNKSLQDLTIQVARMMERLEHTNKRVLDLTANGLRDLFNNKS